MLTDRDGINAVKIVAIGDSITYGYPYAPALSWFNLAAERFRLEYVNQGINGDTTDGMLSRFDRDVLRHKPSHVIIMGGSNDAYGGSDTSQVADNIQTMAQLALQSGATPVIGLPIPCNDSYEESLLGQYREQMRHYADCSGIAYIDFHKAMVDASGVRIKDGLHCDGIHPSKAGYRVMAGVAAEILARLLDRRAAESM